MDNVPSIPSCHSFHAAPAAGLLYLTAAHRDLLQLVRSWTTGGQPLLMLTGEAGAGKSTVAAELEAICSISMRVGLIKGSDAQLSNLPHSVLEALSVRADPALDDPMADLGRLLAACRAARSKCLLIVDNAHKLPDAALDYLEQLTNVPRNRAPLIYVLLIGRSGLEALLARPDHDMLRNRIGGRLRLSPFTETETAAYVAHRFEVSGCSCHAGKQAFDNDGIKLLHAVSGGVPGAIDRLAQHCLSRTRSVDDRMNGAFVHACLSDLARKQRLPHRLPDFPFPEAPKDEHPDSRTETVLASRAEAKDIGLQIPRPRLTLVAEPKPEPEPQTKLLRQRTLYIGLAGVVAGGLVLFGSHWVASTGNTEAPSSAMNSPAVPVDANPVQDVGPQDELSSLQPELVGERATEALPAPDSLLIEALDAGRTNPERAAQLYTRAALWGSDRAAYYLGQLYETGIGAKADLNRARGWYEKASNVPGAEARLAELANLTLPLSEATVAPVPMFQEAFGSGQTELHWSVPEGPGPASFRVEFIPDGGVGQVQHVDTNLSALLIPQPILRWRVIALQADGEAGPASDWFGLSSASR